MVSVQSLVAVDERGAREERALIAAYLRDLVPVLLLHQSEEQLQEVASFIGTTLLGSRYLLAEYWHPSMFSEQAIEFVHASVLQRTAASTGRLCKIRCLILVSFLNPFHFIFILI